MRTRQGYATIAAMSLYDRVADLELVIDDHRYERLEQATPALHPRLDRRRAGRRGRGGPRRGRRSTSPAPTTRCPSADLRGAHTIRSLSARLDAMDRFPGVDEVPAMWQAMADYRRWAFESAALDLALRQAGMSLGTRSGSSTAPVRFCVSAARPGGVAGASTRRWSSSSTRRRTGAREYMERLQATGRVACVDLKSYYEGTVVDNPPDRRLYRERRRVLPRRRDRGRQADRRDAGDPGARRRPAELRRAGALARRRAGRCRSPRAC